MNELTQQQYDQLKGYGWDDTKISALASEKGLSLPGKAGVPGVAGFGLGVAKSAGGLARGTAQVLQGTGQRALSAISGEPLKKIQQTTGFESLDPTKQRGAVVSEALEPKGTAEKVGKISGDIAQFFVPTSGAVGIGGRMVSSVAKEAYKLPFGLSGREADLMQGYIARTPLTERIAGLISGESRGPITNAETAIRNNLFGFKSNIGVQARRAGDRLWTGVIQPALKASDQVVDFTQFTDEIAQQIVRVKDPTRKNALIDALDAMKDDFKGVSKVTMEQLQDFKEGWTQFLPEKTWRGKPISASFREVQNIASQLARNKIYQALGDDIEAAYFDYGNFKNLAKMGQKAMQGEGLKGGTGTLLSEAASRILIPIATTGGLTLYKIGKGLEFVGRPGLKFLGEIFGLPRKTIINGGERFKKQIGEELENVIQDGVQPPQP